MLRALSQLYPYRLYGISYVDLRRMWWVINVLFTAVEAVLCVAQWDQNKTERDAFAVDFIYNFVIRNSSCLVIFFFFLFVRFSFSSQSLKWNAEDSIVQFARGHGYTAHGKKTTLFCYCDRPHINEQ